MWSSAPTSPLKSCTAINPPRMLVMSKKSVMLNNPLAFPNTRSYKIDINRSGETLLRDKITYQKGAHCRDRQNDAIESQQLKDGEPRVHFGPLNRRYLDDAGDHSQGKIQEVGPFVCESSPVGKTCGDPPDHLQIESNRRHEFKRIYGEG